jgi:GNAT superfamily N-acetyltransferase
MNHELYSVRPFVEADYEAEARIDRALYPEIALTAEEIRHYTKAETGEPGRLNFKLAVESRRTGAVIAYGSLHHTSFNYHPRKFRISSTVEPACRRQGVGTELHNLLENEAVARDAICLWSSVRDDDQDGVRFLEKHGFAQRRKTWQSRLDLTKSELSIFPDRSKDLSAQGIKFTTISAEVADRADVRARLYRLSLLVSADVPRLGDYTPVSFEQFVEYDLEGPSVLPDGFFLARADDEFVGMSSLERDLARPDTLRVGFTGTHPNFRGRGIASELKRRAVEFARAGGYRFLVTHNDSLNSRIWTINEKLGFRPEITWLEGEKLLVSARS